MWASVVSISGAGSWLTSTSIAILSQPLPRSSRGHRPLTASFRGTLLWCGNRVEVRFTQAARRHKIGRARVLSVLNNPTVTATIPAPADGLTAERTLWLGADHTGRVLEVVTVNIPGGVLVLHAMDIRDKYRPMYVEQKGSGDHG